MTWFQYAPIHVSMSVCGLQSSYYSLTYIHSLMPTYLVDHMYTQFRLAENSTLPDIPDRKYCPSRPVPVAARSKV